MIDREKGEMSHKGKGIENYCRIRGQSLTGLSPFAIKLYRTYIEYFYFYFIPTWRVVLTTIAVFLFTRQFLRYAILHVKPSAYGIPFFCTSSWWLRVWAELWFVVVCRCTISKKYSENYFNVGIIAVGISRAGPTTTVFFSCILDICGPLATSSMVGVVSTNDVYNWYCFAEKGPH